jgi:UDP-2,3-diacylglucosamine pyrophosphatase LpxH
MFDLASQHRWLCRIGDVGYNLLIYANSAMGFFRRKMGFKNYWSLSKAIKHKVKQACTFISNFEDHLTHHAKEKGCDGVVCGHIHTAVIYEKESFLYCNTGDWVESCTAIVEDREGKMYLQQYDLPFTPEHEPSSQAFDGDGTEVHPGCAPQSNSDTQ